MKPGTDDQATVFEGPAGTSPESPTVAIRAPAPLVPAPHMSSSSTMAEARAEMRTMGLATKYFLMAASLILVTIGSAVAVTAYRANVVADRTVRDALSQVGMVFKSFWAEQEVTLRGTIRTLADEPQTRALLAGDVTPETVKDWAADKTTAIGADFVAVLDPAGSFLARSDKPVDEFLGRDLSHAEFVKLALDGKDSSALVREGDRLYVVAAAPIESGGGETALLEGVIFAGYPLDIEDARAVATLSGSDATFVVAAQKEGAPAEAALLASTFDDAAALLAAIDKESLDRLLVKGESVGPLDLYPRKDHVIAVGFPLRTGSGFVIGGFVSSKSLAEAKAAFTQIQHTLLLVGLLSLLVSLPASYVFGRRIAGPLMALASSAHAIREGNLDVDIPQGAGDEVGFLARSFAQMVSELREKAELEKFVAGLGVSTQDVTQGRVTSQDVSQTLGAAAAVARSAARTELELTPGAVLGGRYVIESLLGQGGMGSVWRARDRELEESVALKVIRNDMLAADPTLADQLKEEIKLARRITHPNILRTHDFGDLDGVRFISMEFVPGPTLRTVLDKRGQLTLPVGLQLGRQICRGLAAAHEAGVIHRDIKPHNIIIAPNGVVKIMDFGIAFSQEKHDAIGGDGQVVGTPDYMSPEQIEGNPVDARADIYAVGVVLYEMFTAVRPFHASTTVQTLMKNLSEDPQPLRKLRPDLPPELELLVTMATAKNPDERLQSASDLRKALGKISS